MKRVYFWGVLFVLSVALFVYMMAKYGDMSLCDAIPDAHGCKK